MTLYILTLLCLVVVLLVRLMTTAKTNSLNQQHAELRNVCNELRQQISLVKGERKQIRDDYLALGSKQRSLENQLEDLLDKIQEEEERVEELEESIKKILG